MSERTNQDWLSDLQSESASYVDALEALRAHLERGVFYYLRHDRSDLSQLPDEDIRQMAQDFVQDALIKILDSLETFRGESKFTTWASKIAARVAISELRRVRYKDYSLEHLTAEGEIMPDLASLGVTPEGSPHPENYAEQQEILHMLKDAFENALTDRQRTALSAYIFDGVPVEEIARRMDTNRNALYKLVHDGRLKLKHYMEDQGLSLEYLLSLFG
ncbi:MAG: RNA polymerase sigma factor [Anaerolineae bacterium]|nr:RNA polymerase sigma factor [Anaerolineae bacterium]